jgi:D-lactate dehydrogenase
MTVAALDRAPDSLAGGAAQPLRGELEALLGTDRVLARASDIVRYASDASPYRLLPRAVVMAREAEDVAKTMAYGRANGVPVVFRAGGTSLNGQGQGDGILVDVRRHFGGVAVEQDGALARVKPGTVLGHANRVLAPHGRKLGPDPASTDIATVGGVIANNSGGMRCGTVHDSYSTVRSLTFVLPSGTTIDTAAPGAAERFAAEEPELAAGLAASASAASSRSRTRPATGSAPSSTPRGLWRSSAACWSARRARSASSPRPSSRPCHCPSTRPPPGCTFPASTRRSRPCANWSTRGRGRSS